MPSIYYEWVDDDDDEREDYYDGPYPERNCGACHGPEECGCCTPCRRPDCESCGYRVANGGDTPAPPAIPRPLRYTRPPWGRHGHTYNPPLDFKGDPPDRMYYGMEVEITCHEYGPMYLAEELAGGLAWTKPDGSVRGMELVTHPMGYDWAMANFPWQMFPQLADAGCTIIPSTNGIHVHAAREGYGNGKTMSSAYHQYLFMKFWYRNQADIQRMARRESGQWAGFGDEPRNGQYAHARLLKNPALSRETDASRRASADLENEFYRRVRQAEADFYNSHERRARYDREYREAQEWYQRETTALARLRLQDTTRRHRYQAVNATNEMTLEMRVFAASLDPVTIQSSLGLVASTVEYTRQLTARDVLKSDGWQWKGYQGWLGDQPKYSAVRYADKHLKYGNQQASILA